MHRLRVLGLADDLESRRREHREGRRASRSHPPGCDVSSRWRRSPASSRSGRSSARRRNRHPADQVLLAALGVVSWASSVVVHTVYTLHYARLYYTPPVGRVDFDGPEEPRFSDFAYSPSPSVCLSGLGHEPAANQPRKLALGQSLLSSVRDGHRRRDGEPDRGPGLGSLPGSRARAPRHSNSSSSRSHSSWLRAHLQRLQELKVVPRYPRSPSASLHAVRTPGRFC